MLRGKKRCFSQCATRSSNEPQAQPLLVAASVANIENCFIKSKTWTSQRPAVGSSVRLVLDVSSTVADLQHSTISLRNHDVEHATDDKLAALVSGIEPSIVHLPSASFTTYGFSPRITFSP